jgi:hypothetical protein
VASADTYTSLYKSFKADNKVDEGIQKWVEKKLAKYPEPPHSAGKVERMLDRRERHRVLPLKDYTGELYQSGIQMGMTELKEERRESLGRWKEGKSLTLDKRELDSNNKRSQLKDGNADTRCAAASSVEPQAGFKRCGGCLGSYYCTPEHRKKHLEGGQEDLLFVTFVVSCTCTVVCVTHKLY